MDSQEKQSVFSDLIGGNGSGTTQSSNGKAAMNYPWQRTGSFASWADRQRQEPTGREAVRLLRTARLIGSEGRLITVNCAEYSDNPDFFLTSLFGYVKGAYTGAEKDSEGLLALADKGMLFLDEIHSLTPECQEKLFLFMDKGCLSPGRR